VELADARLDEHHVKILLKRDDLIHPELPGNKWRKLSHNLATAREQGYATLLTFGGAYSPASGHHETTKLTAVLARQHGRQHRRRVEPGHDD